MSSNRGIPLLIIHIYVIEHSVAIKKNEADAYEMYSVISCLNKEEIDTHIISCYYLWFESGRVNSVCISLGVSRPRNPQCGKQGRRNNFFNYVILCTV